MDDIVNAAGLSKGGLYWHFKSKQALLVALCQAWWEIVREGMAKAAREDQSAGDRLRALFLAVGRGSAAHPELARIHAEGLFIGGRAPEVMACQRAIYDELHAYISQTLTYGISRGEFRPQPVETIASHILAALDGAVVQRPILIGHVREPLQWNVIANSILILLQP